MLRLGLTGGIGSGKSTVAALLAQHGAVVMDADAISRQLTQTGGGAIEAIAQAFGAAFIDAEGAMDRVRMRTLVFQDPAAKSRLESILHPLIGHTLQVQARRAQQAGCRCAVFDIPLLVESSHWRQQLQRVLVVDCTRATQIQRVMQRNAMPEDAVEKIIRTQLSRQRRLAGADWVLFNDHQNLDELSHQVSDLVTHFGL